MKAGKPDSDEIERHGRSLAEGLRAAARARLRPGKPEASAAAMPSPAGRRLAAIVALLIAAGPLATLLGADMLAARHRTDIARLKLRLGPRMAAETAAAQARARMETTMARPTLGATLEAVARALPANAAVARAERMPDGATELDISAADPDQLRPALRSLPGIGNFRNTGQRRSDAGMIVSFRAEPR